MLKNNSVLKKGGDLPVYSIKKIKKKISIIEYPYRFK